MLSITIPEADCLTDEATADLAGKLLREDSFTQLVQEDADIFTEAGDVICKFRKGVIPMEHVVAAYHGLRPVALPNDNRGIAAGTLEEREAAIRYTDRVKGTINPADGVSNSKHRYRGVKKDGTLSNVVRAPEVNSGIVGYYDRSARFPYCRQTAYLNDHPEKFGQSIPLLQSCSKVFRELMPDRWAVQKDWCDRTAPDWVIPDTVYTTVTVNKNWQTACHLDAGDLSEGFGCLTAASLGDYSGYYLCFPKYKIAVDLRSTDMVCANVGAEWHGNTPVRPHGRYERLSIVMYYRRGMIHCLSCDEELKRVKNRKPGDALK